MNKIRGSCLCGKVTFDILDSAEQFYFCHCQQCQKSTGSAFAANVFFAPTNIHWQSGVELVERYDVPDRIISNAFCRECGSRVPYLSKSGKYLVVPAGILDSATATVPKANIFWSEKARYYSVGVSAPCFTHFPDE